MTYARYGLFRYVKEDAAKREPYKNLKSTGPNLRGLARILLFKRFESSVEAFRKTIERFLESNRRFLSALENGMVPAGELAQSMLYQTDDCEEQDFLDALQEASEKYLPKRLPLRLAQEACGTRCLRVGRHSRKGRADYSGTRCESSRSSLPCCRMSHPQRGEKAHLHAIRRHGGLSVRELE